MHRNTKEFALVTPILVAVLAIGPMPANGASNETPHSHHAGVPMTEAEMSRWSESWWATHRPVGQSSQQIAAATFTAQNFIFDSDGNLNTQIDTVRINPGETVMWQWISGTHTVTNGTGLADPNAGTLFDQPLDLTHTSFSFTFMTAGTYHFFCRPHEACDMKGVVIVGMQTSVGPGPGDRRLGFTVDPSPNPTRSGVSFQFSLREAGRARVEILDAQGRIVATLVDRDLGAGSHAVSWDGRSRTSRLAGPGIYYARIRIPGLTDSRRIAVSR